MTRSSRQSRTPPTSRSDFFAPFGLQEMVDDIAGEHVELERPPRAGEHAHTVDGQANVVSIKLRGVCEADGEDTVD